MTISSLRRTLAIGASTAVAATGLAALAPAAHAASESADFVCTVSLLGEQPFTVTADTDLPDTVEQGRKIAYKMTARVSVPDAVRGNARFFFGQQVKGTADIAAKVGSQAVPVQAVLPQTEVPEESGPLVLDVTGSGTWTPSTVGVQQVTVSGFTANLTFIKNGTPAAPLAVPCVAPESGPVVVDTVEVTPATVQATRTTASVKVTKNKAKATVKVVNADRSAASGKVKLTLKKGKKVVAKRTVKLTKKGSKAVTFKKLKKGKYSLLAQFQGGLGSKKSQKRVSFRVR